MGEVAAIVDWLERRLIQRSADADHYEGDPYFIGAETEVRYILYVVKNGKYAKEQE